MPTRKITRASRRLGQSSDKVPEYASLVDLLRVMQLHNVPIIPIIYQEGKGILGRGLSGTILQATVDVRTIYAFKHGVPSKRERDSEQDNSWFSLLTEISVLQHRPIRNTPKIVNLVGVAFSIETNGEATSAWPMHVTLRANEGDLGDLLQDNRRRQDIDNDSLLDMLGQIVDAVDLLHASGKVHSVLIQAIH